MSPPVQSSFSTREVTFYNINLHFFCNADLKQNENENISFTIFLIDADVDYSVLYDDIRTSTIMPIRWHVWQLTAQPGSSEKLHIWPGEQLTSHIYCLKPVCHYIKLKLIEHPEKALLLLLSFVSSFLSTYILLHNMITTLHAQPLLKKSKTFGCI